MLVWNLASAPITGESRRGRDRHRDIRPWRSTARRCVASTPPPTVQPALVLLLSAKPVTEVLMSPKASAAGHVRHEAAASHSRAARARCRASCCAFRKCRRRRPRCRGYCSSRCRLRGPTPAGPSASCSRAVPPTRPPLTSNEPVESGAAKSERAQSVAAVETEIEAGPADTPARHRPAPYTERDAGRCRRPTRT